MASQAENDLIMVAAELQQNELGRKFIKAYEAYAEGFREAAIMSPPELMAMYVGGARQATILLRLLQKSKDEALKLIAAEEAKKRSKPSG